ncbi:MAG TPA: hypothetical protein VFB00_05420 [Terriglobales bacterium]|nr:hypothetical protein [Terriglobales bacterium]
MKRWPRIVLIAVVILFIGLALAAIKIFGLRTFIGPKARPLTDRKFESTPVRLARGKYLVEGALGCMDCHSPHDWSKPDAAIPAGMAGTGDVQPFAGLPGRIVAPNITPDQETGIGNWTDDMVARAIREGIGHDGRALFPLMPYQIFRYLPDEDLASVVVYLRSLPPVKNPLPPTQIDFPVKYLIRNAPEPITSPVPEPSFSNQVQKGEYLVRRSGCGDCHTPVNSHGQRIPGMELSGGQMFEGPWGKVASQNLTPDPTGIPYYDQAMFITVMRTGKVGPQQLNPVMPWWVVRNLNDDDLSAMFAYLKSLKPVRHRVDNSLPPTLCPLDGTMHGGGNLNKTE